MLELVLYSRRGCHLCELMIEELVPLCRGHASLEVHDVDDNPAWVQAYGMRVPVLCQGDTEICVARLDVPALLALFRTRDMADASQPPG